MLDFGLKDNALIKAIEGILITITDEKVDISFERS
jgi:hypothetical protein